VFRNRSQQSRSPLWQRAASFFPPSITPLLLLRGPNPGAVGLAVGCELPGSANLISLVALTAVFGYAVSDSLIWGHIARAQSLLLQHSGYHSYPLRPNACPELGYFPYG